MYQLKVSGMTCGSCATAMRYALKSIDPEVELSVDLKRQTVDIKSKRKKEEVAAMVEETGYPVLEIKELL